MASNKSKLNKKMLSQITLLLLGVLIIFFTYFYTDKQKTVKKTEKEKVVKTNEQLQNKSTFENIEYSGQGWRTMYDRRVNDWIYVHAYLFDTYYLQP